MPQRYELLMDSLRKSLDALLGLDLRADAKLGPRGMFEGRIYTENPHFNVQFALVRISQHTEGTRSSYDVDLRTEMLPGVNDFSKYFPYTNSNRLVKEVVKATRDAITKFEGKPVSITIDKEIAKNALYLVAAEGGAGAFGGGFLGFLMTGTRLGGIYGALAGATIGSALMLVLIFRMFD